MILFFIPSCGPAANPTKVLRKVSKGPTKVEVGVGRALVFPRHLPVIVREAPSFSFFVCTVQGCTLSFHDKWRVRPWLCVSAGVWYLTVLVALVPGAPRYKLASVLLYFMCSKADSYITHCFVNRLCSVSQQP